MFSRKIFLHHKLIATTIERAKALTDEEKKFAKFLKDEGFKGFEHIGAFPLVMLSVFFLPLESFEKVRILKKRSEFKVVNLQKPQVSQIFEHFKPREQICFLILYGDSFDKFKARTTLAARVYHQREDQKESLRTVGE